MINSTGKQLFQICMFLKSMCLAIQSIILQNYLLLISGRSRKFWWGGDFKHKTSKSRMSSPKLRMIFRPNAEIQTFFRPKSGSLQRKKEKKVFTKIESNFSAGFVRFRLVGGIHP